MPMRLVRRADRFVSRYGPWLCYIGLAVVFGLGLMAAQQARVDACVRFRRHDMPVLITEWSTNFAEELQGDFDDDGRLVAGSITPDEQERTDRFVARNLVDLRRTLPAGDC